MWRWPLTLWRFLLAELLRTLLIATAVVVVVASFAVSVRWLANGTLGPLEALKLMALAAVPMLQYALPFAGGFAATLAYHRMSQDNELTACYAGGVSHRRVLVPAGALGVVLGAGLFVMADQVMPRFLRQMQELITDDATRLLQAAIGRGQALERGNQLLYADKLVERQPQPGSGAYRHFLLQGVVAVELDSQRNVKRELAAPLAEVWLFHDTVSAWEGATEGADAGGADAGGGRFAGVGGTLGGREQVTRVFMRLKDPLAGRGETAVGTADSTEVRMTLPSAFRDDPKYLSWAELASAKARPEKLNLVANPKRRLAMLVAQRELARQMSEDLRQRGVTRLVDGQGREVRIGGSGIEPTPGVRGQAIVGRTGAAGTGGGGIEVQVFASGTGGGGVGSLLRTHRAERAFVTPTAGGGDGTTSLTLVLENVTTVGATGGAGAGAGAGAGDDDVIAGSLSELMLPGLRQIGPAGGRDPAQELATMGVDGLLDRATGLSATQSTGSSVPEAGGVRDPLAGASANLRGSIDDLRNEITSKQHERLAASLACLVMIVLGAVMGMKLASAPPLVVYLWSFLPAIGALVSIAAGQSMTHDHGVIGLPVMYGGVVALGVFTFAQYRRVAKH
jgi:lipopolysaccharide export system permease protein